MFSRFPSIFPECFAPPFLDFTNNEGSGTTRIIMRETFPSANKHPALETLTSNRKFSDLSKLYANSLIYIRGMICVSYLTEPRALPEKQLRSSPRINQAICSKLPGEFGYAKENFNTRKIVFATERGRKFRDRCRPEATVHCERNPLSLF